MPLNVGTLKVVAISGANEITIMIETSVSKFIHSLAADCGCIL